MSTATKTAIRLDVRGHGGLLEGAHRSLKAGEALVIGRSRSCDLSLRKTKAFRKRGDAPALLDSKQFNRVSRIHCEIAYHGDGRVEIRDLSQNGTLVNGVRAGRSHVVELGGERVVVELVDSTWGKLLLCETRPEPAAD